MNKNITLNEYIETRYGTHRGAKADFLRDNPSILPQELTRWSKVLSVHLITGELYKPSAKKINLKDPIKTED